MGGKIAVPHRVSQPMLERRLQDLERKFQNLHRVGKITEKKFDEDKKRWYVKMTDADGDDGAKTDWLPWKTFSHGAIKITVPPREGMSVVAVSPNGTLEQAYCEAYHNNPKTPSPSDKPDEFHMRVEMPNSDGSPGTDKNQILDFHFTKDGSTVKIGDTTHQLTKDTIAHTTKTNSVSADTDASKSKTHSVETDTRTVKAKTTDIKSDSYSLGGKVLINC